MSVNRRQLILLTISAATASCCNRLARATEATAPTTQPGKQPPLPPGAVDDGPLSDFKTDDVYDAFREQGFFVIRRDDRLFALSSICTHKGCKVRVADDLSFFCKCHKSTFDKDGHVTHGPARRDLPRLEVAEDGREHLLVNLKGVPPAVSQVHSSAG
jgi:Rieske Fe-S protein